MLPCLTMFVITAFTKLITNVNSAWGLRNLPTVWLVSSSAALWMLLERLSLSLRHLQTALQAVTRPVADRTFGAVVTCSICRCCLISCANFIRIWMLLLHSISVFSVLGTVTYMTYVVYWCCQANALSGLFYVYVAVFIVIFSVWHDMLLWHRYFVFL